MSCKIRPATLNDASLIVDFIRELASFEQLENEVVATISSIEKTLFCESPRAEALIIENDLGEAAGFALFFHNYSTFLGRYGIYIEDIYIREHYRGQGFGKAILKHICTIAQERDCGRVEWWCLDWNKPSIDFYLGLGAEAMSDWTVYRLDQKAIQGMATGEKVSRT